LVAQRERVALEVEAQRALAQKEKEIEQLRLELAKLKSTKSKTENYKDISEDGSYCDDRSSSSGAYSSDGV